MSDFSLSRSDYNAVAKAMDVNGDNLIDRSEARISDSNRDFSTNTVGAVANSLANGDVFVSRISEVAADRVAEYFSDRDSNVGLSPRNWSSDNWISRNDLPMNNSVRDRIDDNWDGKVSKNEFAEALVDRDVTIGNRYGTVSSYNHNDDVDAADVIIGAAVLGAVLGEILDSDSKPSTHSYNYDSKPSTHSNYNYDSKPSTTSHSNPFSDSKPSSSQTSNPFGSSSKPSSSQTSNPFGSSSKPSSSQTSSPFSSSSKPQTSNPFGSSSKPSTSQTSSPFNKK